LSTGCVQYITTGGAVPPGANAVIKVEDTKLDESGRVTISVGADVGLNIRQIGSDMRYNEMFYHMLSLLKVTTCSVEVSAS
jgi:molybdopterin biosynthesis enzyme